jgi:hypothetical protein
MSTPADQAIVPGKSKIAAPRQDARSVSPAIISTTVTKVARQAPQSLTVEERHALIAEAAYYLAEQRHFEPGHEEEDWLAAEVQVDNQDLKRS